MRITKYEHATLVVEKDGRRLIIDPGSFTTQLPDVTAVDAVVITHEHPDHFTSDHLRAILDASPEATLYGPEGVAAAASDFDITVVQPGDEIDAGAFTLRFFGGTHSVIHWTVPIIDNVGVLVDDTLYYPGDSYAVPGGVDVERAPHTGAPEAVVLEPRDEVGPPAEGGVERGDLVGRGALLRSVDRGRAARPGERVVDVDGDAPAHGAGTRVEAGVVDGGDELGDLVVGVATGGVVGPLGRRRRPGRRRRCRGCARHHRPAGRGRRRRRP